MEQVIIIGGTGQIGHRLIESFIGLDYEHSRVLATSRKVENELPSGGLASTIIHQAKKWGPLVKWMPLNLEDDSETLAASLTQIEKHLKKDVLTIVIIAAAYTNVDGCEKDPTLCKKINETNTKAVLDWAIKKYSARVVFYSTDYVFDGAEGPYGEDEPRQAVQVYGQSKVTIEEWIENNSDDYLILRTTGVFDYLPGSKNFLMQMLDLWGQGKPTRIPSDQYSNPVWAGEIAKATFELLMRHFSGIYNVAGGSYLSRVDFAQTIAKVFDSQHPQIEAILTSSLQQLAKRPLRGGLKMDKLKTTLGWAPMSAENALRYLHTLQNQK